MRKTEIRNRLLFTALMLPMVLLLAGTSCGQDLDDTERKSRMMEMYREYAAEFPGVGDTSPEQALAWAEAGEAVFIDVRAADEQAVSMIPGALSREEFLSQKDELEGKVLVAYCTIGYRSGQFAQDMEELGLQVLNLQAGVLGWAHAGGRLRGPDGAPIARIHVYGRTWNLAPKTFEAVW